jgi:hypothetical protein
VHEFAGFGLAQPLGRSLVGLYFRHECLDIKVKLIKRVYFIWRQSAP